MGYRVEKEKIEKNKKWLKRILLGVLLLIIVGLAVFSAFVPPASWKYYFSLPDVERREYGELRVHFLDVGQGDSTLIELPDGKTMLIDAGDGSSDASKAILRYLNALKIDTLDYLVITHADGDHCGGAAELLKYKHAEIAYIPPAKANSDTKYAQAYAALMKSGSKCIYSSRDIDSLGKSDGEYPYTLSFLSPYAESVENVLESEAEITDDNLYSAVIWLDYQGTSVLFTGDIPERKERDLIRDDQLGFFENRGVSLSSTEILKVAHHGSSSSTCSEFLEYLGVKTAVISCGETNAYGHPSKETLSRLTLAGAELYRTDLQGHIVVTISPDGSYEQNIKTLK